MTTNNIVTPGVSNPLSIAFVDGNVAQADELLASLQTDKVFLLNDQSSGIDQITQTLADYTNLESVHIVSHGSQGALQLGNSIFSQTNLTEYQADLESWQTAFSDHGDLLFYGCNLAAADATFVNQISQLTQTDVAASNDLTGTGGDWDLEVTTGSIEATIGLSAAAQTAYQGQLNLLIEGSTGTIDILNGTAGADMFVLGDETGSLYAQHEYGDYADILNFSAGEDTILLAGSIDDYTLKTEGNNTWIFVGDAYSSELVADVFNASIDEVTSNLAFVEASGADPDPTPNPDPTPDPGDLTLIKGSTGTIDILNGTAGADMFVLGDETGSLYAQHEYSDYADILNFSAGEDTILLAGSIDDYTLKTEGNNTWIFVGDAYSSELVADVFNASVDQVINSLTFIGDTPTQPEGTTIDFSNAITINVGFDPTNNNPAFTTVITGTSQFAFGAPQDAIINDPLLGSVGTVDGNGDVILSEIVSSVSEGPGFAGADISVTIGDGTPDLIFEPGSAELSSVTLESGGAVVEDTDGLKAFYQISLQIQDAPNGTLRNLNPITVESDFIGPISSFDQLDSFDQLNLQFSTNAVVPLFAAGPDGVFWTGDEVVAAKLVPGVDGKSLTVNLQSPSTEPPVGTSNGIINGSFEANQINRRQKMVDASQVDGWKSLNGEPLEIWRSGFNGVESDNGSQHLELDADKGKIDGIYQDVQTAAGQIYELTFTVRSRGEHFNSNDEAVVVEWNGQKLKVDGFRAEKAGEWSTITARVIGTGGMDRLLFRESTSYGANDSTGPFLDNITLRAIAQLNLPTPPGFNAVFGGPGNDQLSTSEGNDFVLGDDGDDILSGNGGVDLLQGEAGNDILNGGNQNDQLNGGIGNDTLNGGHGNDQLLGGEGNDLLSGDRGDDQLDGGAGDDVAVFRGVKVVVRQDDGQIGVQSKDGEDVLSNIEYIESNGTRYTVDEALKKFALPTPTKPVYQTIGGIIWAPFKLIGSIF